MGFCEEMISTVLGQKVTVKEVVSQNSVKFFTQVLYLTKITEGDVRARLFTAVRKLNSHPDIILRPKDGSFEKMRRSAPRLTPNTAEYIHCGTLFIERF